jgi:hypothetical protein
MKLPESLKIGPYTYRLEEWPHDEAADRERWGECCYKRQVLRVDTSYSGDRILSILLHETLHAIFEAWTIDLERVKDSEDIVNPLAKGLSAVLVDNPELVDWIRRVVEDGGTSSSG